jgi:hypothetical protein
VDILTILDYSIQEFEFLVGGVDFSPYLESLSVSSGNSDITTPIVWRGEFAIVRTQNCPLTEDDFSEFASPARWRRGVAVVNLNFYGLPGLNLRIDSYRYYNGKGSGKLTQVLDLVEFDRPSEEIGDFSYGKQWVGTAIAALLRHALQGRGTFDLGVFVPTDSLAGELTTRTPIADAQKLCGIYWQWLYVDATGVIRTTTRGNNPMPLFVRPAGKFEAVPDEEAIHFAAEKVIVSGSHEIAKPYVTTEDDEVEAIATIKAEIKKVEKSYKYIAAAAIKARQTVEKLIDEQPLYEEQVTAKHLDEAGRSLRTEVLSKKPAGVLFPGSSTAGSGLVTSQRKRIYNFYEDGNEDATTLDFPRWLRSDVTLCQPVSGFGNGTGLYCTVVIVEEPIGFVYPQRGYDTGLITSSITIEGIQFKRQYQSAGVVFPWLGVDTGLVISSQETIDSGLPLVGIGTAIASIKTQDKEVKDAEVKLKELNQDLVAAKLKFTSPKTGITQRYERAIEPEPKVESPEVELITESFKGEAILKGVGWNPFVAKVQVESVGFLPSQGTADSLARRIAFREIARRDGLIVEMPLPIEWVGAGCPPFALAYLDRDAVVIDAPIIEMKDKTLVFSFTGERLGSVPQVTSTIPAIAPITAVVIETLERRATVKRSVRLVEVEAFRTALMREVRLQQLSVLVLPTVERRSQLIEIELLRARSVRVVRLVPAPLPEIWRIPGIRSASLLEVNVLGVASAVVKRSGQLVETAAGAIGLSAIAHWTLDTTAWLDSIGSATLTKTGTVTSAAGRVGNAANFGAGGVPPGENFLSSHSSAFDASAPWMISFKFQNKVTTSSSLSTIRRFDSGNGRMEWSLELRSNGTLGAVTPFNVRLRVYGTSGSTLISCDLPRNISAWRVIFAEVTATELRLTVDGVRTTTPLTITPRVLPPLNANLEIIGNDCRFDDVYFYK